jgi:hypothetical protein
MPFPFTSQPTSPVPTLSQHCPTPPHRLLSLLSDFFSMTPLLVYFSITTTSPAYPRLVYQQCLLCHEVLGTPSGCWRRTHNLDKQTKGEGKGRGVWGNVSRQDMYRKLRRSAVCHCFAARLDEAKDIITSFLFHSCDTFSPSFMRTTRRQRRRGRRKALRHPQSQRLRRRLPPTLHHPLLDRPTP